MSIKTIFSEEDFQAFCQQYEQIFGLKPLTQDRVSALFQRMKSHSFAKPSHPSRSTNTEKKKEICSYCQARNQPISNGEKIVWKIQACCALAKYCSDECKRKDLLQHRIECLNPKKK